MVMDNADYYNQAYEIESVAGIDPAMTRLAFPGEITVWEPRHNIDRRLRYRPHSRDPAGAYDTYLDSTLHVEYMPFNEFNAGANSIIALAVGSAPNGTTGVITNLNDLRTFTVQYGLDLSTDVFHRMRYCVIDQYTLTIEEKEPVKVSMDIMGIFQPGTDEASSEWAALPSVYDGAPWASTGHVTWTLSAATFNGDLTGGTITIKNFTGKINALNQTANTASKTFTGGRRETNGTFNFIPDDTSDFDVFKTDPNLSGGFFDQIINFTKDWDGDATNEYMNISIPNCMLGPDSSTVMRYDVEQTDAHMNQWNWMHKGGTASPIAIDVNDAA